MVAATSAPVRTPEVAVEVVGAVEAAVAVASLAVELVLEMTASRPPVMG